MQFHLKLASILAHILDARFSFMGFRFGIAALFGIIPGVGDIIDVILSLYIVWVALSIHIPKSEIFHMLFNVLVAFLIGTIPFLGDTAYMLYKPNLRNIKILERYAQIPDRAIL